jgi:hypothetical protein
MKLAAAALLAAALIVIPATAYADDPVPTVDQVVAIMAELTDPGRPPLARATSLRRDSARKKPEQSTIT